MLEVRSQTLGAGVELETQVPNWAVFFFFSDPFHWLTVTQGKEYVGAWLTGRQGPPKKSTHTHTHLESVFFCRGGQVCRRVFPFQGSLASQVFFFSIDKMSKKTICGVGSGVLGCGQDFFRSFLESGFL